MDYFALLARDITLSADKVIPSCAVLEAHEHYAKQTWRNRCRILAATGPDILQVPVIHDAPKMPIREVRIEYTTPWVVRTERAIDSAYRTSAYFEFYREDLYTILDAQPEYLFDLNLSILRFFLEKLGLPVRLSLSDDFTLPGTVEDDWRFVLTPKKPNTILQDLGLGKPYYQVFSGKYGFVPGLSVMDLLFNEGPDSILYLKSVR